MQNIFSIITLGFFLFACGDKKSEEPNKQSGEAAAQNSNIVSLTPEQLKNAGIETGKLHLTNISSVLKVSGEIDVPPQNLVTISVPMGGYLQTTRMLPGMQVKKGEVIAV